MAKKIAKKASAEAVIKPTKQKFQLERTPVVAVMGHVDHGKTSLLDAIRGTNIQAGEAGGITQNTRAHQITFHDHKITFIDTPGHEAFSSMRSRGAKVTDIVMLVVAVDDGVQPQTKESIKFALEQKVPIIVAINKIDLPGKNPQKIRQELSTAGLSLEEYGGDVMVAEVSAIKKTGLDDLLERILLIAEVNELKNETPTDYSGKTFLLESALDKNKGAVSLGIVKAGKITVGDFVVYNGGYSKIRQLLDQQQQNIETAEQGDPIWIIGIDDVLDAGTVILNTESEKQAKDLAKAVEAGEVVVEETVETPAEAIDDLDMLSQMFTASQVKEDKKYLNIVLRTDAQGTLEAVRHELSELNDDEVEVKIIESGTGQITEKDILTAKNSKGIVIGFQADMDKRVEEIARKEKVLIRNYEVIYDLISELADAMESLLGPQMEEVEVARAKVKMVFTLSNGDKVAGCEVTKGNFIKGYRAYVARGQTRMGEGKIVSLKHLKEEMREVKKGQDCGVILQPAVDFAEGDEIVCFKQERV